MCPLCALPGPLGLLVATFAWGAALWQVESATLVNVFRPHAEPSSLGRYGRYDRYSSLGAVDAHAVAHLVVALGSIGSHGSHGGHGRCEAAVVAPRGVSDGGVEPPEALGVLVVGRCSSHGMAWYGSLIK